MGFQLHYVVGRRGRLHIRATDCDSIRRGPLRTAEREYSNQAEFQTWLAGAVLPRQIRAAIEADLAPVAGRIGDTFASDELPLTEKQLAAMGIELPR